MRQEVIEIIELLESKTYIIEEMMESKKKYKRYKEMFYDFIKEGFEEEQLRRQEVHFKFNYSDKETHSLRLPSFIVNMMLWTPYMKLGVCDELNEDNIMDTRDLTSNTLSEYINNRIIRPYRSLLSNKELNKLLHDVTFDLSRISKDFNILLGISISVHNFIDVAEKNPRFNEILRTKIDPTLQPSEIEEIIDNLMKEEIDILKTEDNMLKPILSSGAGIKHKQLAEFSICGGFKPDLFDKTIPIMIDSNFLVGGLSNIFNYYIDALGGRKAAILNKTVMGKSGHFSKMVGMLEASVMMSKQKDCGTLYTVDFEVKSKKHLLRLDGRNYRLKGERKLRIIDATKDTHLIGQTIQLRSPAKCAAKDGICKTCYGSTLYEINKDISPGNYAGVKISMPVSQNVLSTKHLLATDSDLIEFSKRFYELFTFNSNEIVINKSNDELDYSAYSIIINKEDMESIDAFSDDEEYNHYIKRFYVRKKGDKENFMIEEANNSILYISNYMMRLLKRDKKKKRNKESKAYYEIPFNIIDEDTSLFLIEIRNNGSTKPLYQIMDLLDNKEHNGCETIDEMCNMITDLLIESHIDVPSVHSEILFHPLIRKADNILERPDFNNYGANDNYVVLTVKSALENHPSALVGISFQYLKRQLSKPQTYEKKAKSFLDPFFKKDIGK